MTSAHILIVEDERVVARGLQMELEGMGYRVPGLAASGDEAVELVSVTQPDLILMDIVLKGELDGVQTAQRIREQYDIPIVYLSAYEDKETLGRAKATEPFGYLLKRLTGRPPTRHKVFKVILFMGWAAIFFERILLVFPSISKENQIPYGLIDILVTVGFFALFVLSRNWFLARYRPVLNLPR